MIQWRQFALQILLLPWLSALHHQSFLATAADTLTVGESITGNRTMVSEGGQFELGFFSPAGGNPSSGYYVGVWYKQIPVQTVVWVMNRDYPVSHPSAAELTVASDGDLVLLLVDGELPKKRIWSSSGYTRTSKQPAAATAAAVLLDTGNLVLHGDPLMNNSSEIIWQSFEHPTDTLVPGSWVGMNKRTGAYQSLRSWRNDGDPSTGLYMDRVDPYGSGQYIFMWNGTTIYHYVGPWTGQRFSSVPEMGISSKYKYISVNNDDEISFSFQVTNRSLVSRMVMRPNGQLTLYTWFNGTSNGDGEWLLHWATPAQCDVYSVCGPFGLCDMASSQHCRCLPGFEPAPWEDLAGGGCTRKTSLQCSNGASTDGFLAVQNVRLPSSNLSLASAGDPEECAAACAMNCSCMAYAYRNKSGCLIWGSGLRNVQLLADGDAGAYTLFLRLAAGDLAAGNRGTSTSGRDAILAVSSAVLLMMMLCLFVAWRRRRREKTTWHDGPVSVFSHGYLLRCTKNYSEKLGMGSFGSVYKGTLHDQTVVAVKKLEGSAARGEKQFRAEVKTLGTAQHTNLVRLRGFCVTRHDRLLVYDYMPNGSLASAMAGPSFGLLDWGTRFRIMAGVARGLAYLHEQCRERIVHCDVKPENILLDASFRPKVADFGMAKLIGRGFSGALTTARGTLGYLAPEWIHGLPITPKADVYSYGMTLLELIAGRRNRDAGRGVGYFPLWAATEVREGRFLAVLDERLAAAAGGVDMAELGRACNVACWCIQQGEALRPTMGQVVQVLEGSVEIGVAPVPRYLELFCSDNSCTF